MTPEIKSKKRIYISVKKLTATWPKVGYDGKDEGVLNFYRKVSGTTTDRKSLFAHKRLADVFIFAMALGKNEGLKKPYEHTGDRKATIDMEYFATTPDYVWMMIAIAIVESNGDLSIFENPETKIIDVCEQYANYGIRLLMDMEERATVSDPHKGYEEKFEELLDQLDK